MKIHPRTLRNAILAGSIAAFLATPEARATNYYWDTNGTVTTFGGGITGIWNGTNAFWNTASNGTGGTPIAAPTSTDDLFVNGGATGTITISGAQSASSITLSFAVTKTISGGTSLTIGGTGTNSGLFSSASTTTISTPVILNASSTAITFRNTGAVFTIGATTGAATSGTQTISAEANSGSSLTLNGIIGDGAGGGKVAVNYSGTSTGGFVVSGNSTYSGGTTINSTGTTGILAVTTATGFGSGTVTINGGSIRATTGGSGTTLGNAVTLGGNFTAATIGTEKNLTFTGPVTLTGNRTITANLGATVNTQALIFSGAIGDGGSGFGLTQNGTGRLTLSGANTYRGDTIISNGKVILGNALALQNSAYDTTGSTGVIGLDVTGFATPTFGGLKGGVDLATAITGYGGVTALTLNPQSGVASYSGVIADGSVGMTLTKTGAGSQTLSGPNTYTGATAIDVGTLNISNTLTSAINVAASANLGGEGSTTGNVTFAAGSGFLFDPSTTGANQHFRSTGTIDTTAGATTKINIGLSSPISSGTGIVVMEGTTLTTNGASDFLLSSRGTLSTTATQVLFDYTAGNIVWKGASGTNPTFWDVNTTAQNFKLGGVDDFFFNGDNVTFDDNASSFAVVVQGASIAPGSVIFDTATNNYTVGGGAIGGGGSLTKIGVGGITLNSTNTYSGATTINVGTLAYGASDVIGSGTVTVDGATAVLALGSNSDTVGAVSLKNGGSITGSSGVLSGFSYAVESGSVSAILGGAGSTLTKSTGGTVTLSNASTYSGATTVSAGTLSVTGSILNSAVQINGGTLQVSGGIALSNTGAAGVVNIADAAGATFQVVGSETIGALTGGGATGGAVSIDALQTLTLASGTQTYAGTIGGAGVLTGAGALQTLNGAISSSGGINVTSGVLTLGSSSNSYTGTTLLNASVTAGAGILVTANGALGAIGAGNGTTIIGVPVSPAVTTSQLGFSGSINYSMAEKITGSGVGGAGNVGAFIATQRGFIQSVSGNNTFAGDIELSANGLSRIGTQDGAQLTLTGAITQATGVTTANILFRAGNTAGDFVTLSNAGNSFGGDSQVFTSLATPGSYAGVRLGITNGLPTNLTISGFGTTGAGAALDLAGFNQSLNGLITGGSAMSIINMNTGTPSTLTLNPTADKSSSNTLLVGGGGLEVINVVKDGAFIQGLGATNTYTGTTSIQGGGLEFRKQLSLYNNTSASWTAANITVDSGATLGLLVGGSGEFTAADVGTIATNLTAAIASNGLKAGSFLGINVTADTTVSTVLTDSTGTGGGAVGLTKTGAATLTLDQANTYTGGTAVNNGTLILNGADTGTGVIRGTVNISAAATLQLASANALGYNTGVRVETVNINGGTMDNVVNGDQGFNQTYNLTGGTMRANGGVSSPVASQWFAFGSGFGGTTAVNTFASATTSAIEGRVIFRNDNLNTNIDFTVADGAAATDLLISAAITQNAGLAIGLTKAGAGLMQLTGTNSYAGLTSITNGILSIAASAQLGDASATNTIAINGGTLQDTGAGVTLGANRSVAIGASGGTVDVAAASDMTISGAISGAGNTLTKTGSGTLKINGVQTYGTLTTGAGRTDVNSTLGTGTSTVNANATTNFSTSQTLAALNIGAGAVVTFSQSPPPFAGLSAGVVPEPGSLSLLLIGALGLAARRNRRGQEGQTFPGFLTGSRAK